MNAQTVQDVEELEHTYQSCMQMRSDTTTCGKTYLRQVDSIMDVLYDKVKNQLPSSKRAGFIKEQQSWTMKKEEFFKKQDENFVYNVKEGVWKPSMFWVVNENKADYIKKRAITLAKKLE